MAKKSPKYREVFHLPGNLYSRIKRGLKKLYKKHGLKFSGNYQSQFWRWTLWEEGPEGGEPVLYSNGRALEEIYATYEKDVEGVTTDTVLKYYAWKRTPFYRDLLEFVEEHPEIEHMTLEEWEEKTNVFENALNEFDNRWYLRIMTENNKAKRMGFDQSPFLDNLVKDFLIAREERFGLSDMTREEAIENAMNYRII